MKFKNKIVISSIVSIIIFSCVVLYVRYRFIALTYDNIERNEAEKSFLLTVDQLKEKIKLLKKAASGISQSSVVVEPVSDKNSKLPNSILRGLFSVSGFDVAYIYGEDGRLIYSYRNGKSSNSKKIKLLNECLLKSKSLLVNDSDLNKTRAGLFNTPEGNVIIALASISDKQEKEQKGILIGAYFVSKNYLAKIVGNAGSELKLYFIKDEIHNLPQFIDINNLFTESEKVFCKTNSNDNYFACYSKLSDINGQYNFLIVQNMSRSVYIEAETLLNIILYVVIIVGVIIIFFTTNGIQYVVVKPIKQLTAKTQAIIGAKNLTLRTGFGHRKDEVGTLSKEFDMLLAKLQEQLKLTTEDLEGKIKDLMETKDDAIFRIAMAIENKDSGSPDNHVRKIREMMTLFGQKLHLPKKKCELFGIASTLHDIGKIGVPEYILGKNGKYTAEEYNAMKSHTSIGGKIFSGGKTELVKVARDIAMYHHESWDGQGYIAGVVGSNIPLPARMMTIIDVFTAMLSVKRYRKNFTSKEVVDYMKLNSGKIFDPELLDVFLNNIDEFLKIYQSGNKGFIEECDKPVQ